MESLNLNSTVGLLPTTIFYSLQLLDPLSTFVFSFKHVDVQVWSSLLVSVYLFLTLRDWYRLRMFPGPILAQISRLWIYKRAWSKDLHLQTWRLTSELGPVVRVGPRDIVTDDLDQVLKMSSVRSTYSRSDSYSGNAFDVEVLHVFSERNEERHLDLRRKLAAGYSGKENAYIEGSIDKQIQNLVDLIDKSYLSTPGTLKAMDFGRAAQYFTLDTITEVAFGRNMGFLTRDEDINGYCKVSEQALPIFEWLGAMPTINAMFRWPILRTLLMPSPKDRTGVGMMMRYAKEVVAERFEPGAESKLDMLGSFLKHGITRREAETEATFQILVGSDTTATALRAAICYIVTNPRICNSLQAELDEAVRNGNIQLPILTDQQAAKLPYLLATIRETLRIVPPAFPMLQKLTPPTGDVISGRFVPGNVRVGTCVYGILRSPKIFGDDANEFRPERWLQSETDDAKLSRMTKAADAVFGSGRYMCLGKTVAAYELRKTVATVRSHSNMS